jgi:hypothetical protein
MHWEDQLWNGCHAFKKFPSRLFFAFFAKPYANGTQQLPSRMSSLAPRMQAASLIEADKTWEVTLNTPYAGKPIVCALTWSQSCGFL